MIPANVYLFGSPLALEMLGVNRFPFIGVTMGVLLVVYSVSVFVLKKKWKPEVFVIRFWVTGSATTFFAVLFLLSAFLVVELSGVSLVYWFLMVVALLLSVLLFFRTTISKIHKGEFSNRKNTKRSDFPGFALAGSFAGVALARRFLLGASRGMALDVLALCYFALALIFSVGTIHFLVGYYVNKYSIESDGLESVIALELNPPKKKMSTVKKVFLGILAVFVSFTIVACIIPT
jgi:hypothetical protein